MGNGSSGAGGLVGGRTGVIQGYTGTSGAAGAKAKGKTGKAGQAGQVDEAKVDRIDRDDESNNQMLVEIIDERKEKREGDVLCPPGHSPGVRWVDGDAFRCDKNGRTIAPTFGDVDQGNLGDSWLMATLASVAHACPKHLLERCDKSRDSNDEFGVRLGKLEVRIRPEFSSEGYADPLPSGQTDTLWVALFEKAFAKRSANSYANLELGNPARALELLTGKPSYRMSIHNGTSLEALTMRLDEGKRDSRAMVLTTRESGVSSPLHPEHAYAIIGVHDVAGSRCVKVYNPWGTKGGTRSIESVIYEVKLDDVRSNGASLFVSGG